MATGTESNGQGAPSSESDARPAPAELAVPAVQPKRLGRNFVKLAIVELRFPTVFEFEEARPPAPFWHSIRRDYPFHDVMAGVTIGPGSVDQGRAHHFRGAKGNGWLVSLRPSAISIESARYASFDEFMSRAKKLIDAAKLVIESDFFTRVGLRYVNVVPLDGKTPFHELVNRHLNSALSSGAFGNPLETWQTVRGRSGNHNFLFQHGYGAEGAQRGGYNLDLDFYGEEIPVDDAPELIAAMHSRLFDLFWWSLGPTSQRLLETGK